MSVHPVDLHVGTTIRATRRAKGISQSHLAGVIGVSFQQVQKYERGTNRVSASKLYEIAEVLKAPPASFFPATPVGGAAIYQGGMA